MTHRGGLSLGTCRDAYYSPPRNTPARTAAASVRTGCCRKKLDPPARSASLAMLRIGLRAGDAARESRVRLSKTNAANATAQRTAAKTSDAPATPSMGEA